MKQSLFQYVLGQLSVLSDEELKNIDIASAMSILEDDDISKEDKKSLTELFTHIQEYSNLYHHGVKGMRWGIRKYQNKDGTLTPEGLKRYQDAEAKKSVFGTASSYKVKTRSGDEITVEPVKPLSAGEKIVNALLGISEKDQLGRRGDANYTLKDSNGKEIGELSLISKDKDVAYLDWITVYDDNRGKGYATDIINDLLQKAKDSGYSKVELNALKDPRPLYERLGFTYKDTSKMSIMDRINSFEFGCKHMEYDLNKMNHSENLFYVVGGVPSSEEIYHYGVKGQKWGVRRYQNEDGSLTDAGKKKYAADEEKRIKESRKQDLKNRRNMSDSELEAKIKRLKMEREFKSLTEEDISPGKKATKEILSSAGKKVLSAAVAGGIAYGVKVAMTKQFNPAEAASYIVANPNKKK